MLDENPGLLQLRILQQLGESPGSTVVYGQGDGFAARAPATGASRGRNARAAADDAAG